MSALSCLNAVDVNLGEEAVIDSFVFAVNFEDSAELHWWWFSNEDMLNQMMCPQFKDKAVTNGKAEFQILKHIMIWFLNQFTKTLNWSPKYCLSKIRSSLLSHALVQWGTVTMKILFAATAHILRQTYKIRSYTKITSDNQRMQIKL